MPISAFIRNQTSITGTSGVWTNVTPADMNLAVDLSGISSNPTANDSFAAVGGAADLSRPGVGYVGGCYQGVWRTADYGASWTKTFTATGGFDGCPWTCRVAPDGSYVIFLNGYGRDLGLWKSTDQGVSFTNVLPAGDVEADVHINPSDSLQVMSMPHGNGATWHESLDGCGSWTDHGSLTPGDGCNGGVFVSSSVYLARGPLGLFRMVKSGGSWTSTLTLAIDGPHGGTSFWRDAVNQFIYVGGVDSSDGRQKIWRTTFASGGAVWTVVDDALGGGGYATCTIWGSATKIFAHANFATHGTWGPTARQASPSAGTVWTDAAANFNAGMINGAMQGFSMTDGVRTCHIGAFDNAGIWRYIE